VDRSQRLLALKRDYLVPCVYHFYRKPPVLVRGEGAFLYDAEGRKYLDCYGGVSVVNAGHCNAEINDAAIAQIRALQHTTTVYLTEPMLELARTIAEIAPRGLKRFFFCASGSEANEGALLLAALSTGRSECIYLTGGLHGRTKWAMSVTGLDMWRTDPQPLMTAHAVPGPCSRESLPAIEKLLIRGNVAAVIAEPVQGNGGIIVPPEDYWPELRRLCTKHGALLIADEVQTAWNRTGRWFAVSRWGVVPDVIAVAKALGNGFPIAAYITTDAHAAKYTRPGAATFGGNLVSCRAALATLRYHHRNNLGARSEALGIWLRGKLGELAARHEAITDVRGLGLMVGVELRDAALMDDLLEDLKDAGYLLGKTGPGRNVLTIMPPLVVTQEALAGLVESLDEWLTRKQRAAASRFAAVGTR
jgi:4-aminobutyrate aminotransferase-like enzyme